MFTVDTHHVKIKPLSTWELSLLFLFIFAILLPTAPQAVLTALAGFWFLIHRGWRLVLSQSNNHLSSRILKLFILSIAISTFFHIFGFLAELVQSEFSFKTLMIKHFKLMGKQGIWGIFMVMSIQLAAIKGFTLERISRSLIVALSALTLYMVCQRYFGIDWVHGFSVKIPDNRFAFGVYRAAGLMAHPLTFGYNVGLFALAMLGIGLNLHRQDRSPWMFYSLFFLAFVCLVLSVSRWPLVLTCFISLFMVPFYLRKKIKWYKAILFIAILALLGSYSLRGRISEVIADSRPIEEKIPRVIFWKVHWEMFKERPVWGTGFVGKDVPTIEQYDKLGYNNLESKYSAHNIYLQTLADSGMVGFIGLLALLVGLSIASWEVYRRSGNPLLMVIVSYTVLAGFMQNNLRDSEYLFALWLAIAMVSIVDRNQDVAARSKIKDFKP